MQNPTTELQVRHTSHSGDRYSIGIDVENVQVSMSSGVWTHKPGNHSTLTIFDLTPEDVMHLGNLIIEQAFRIKGLQEAGNEDKV